jgi:hypothetical protein
MAKKQKSADFPAFPFEYTNNTSSPQPSFIDGRTDLRPNAAEQYGGLSARDWFAGLAMQALITSPNGCGVGSINLGQLAYEAADAMLKARLA